MGDIRFVVSDKMGINNMDTDSWKVVKCFRLVPSCLFHVPVMFEHFMWSAVLHVGECWFFNSTTLENTSLVGVV